VAIDVSRPLSPGWWLARLARKLVDRQDHYSTLESYYDGSAAIPVPATKAIRQSYQRLMAMAGTNYAALVVEAVRERMQPLAFRTGAVQDEGGDAAAWDIWQANQLDADSALVHRASLAMGAGYVIVGGVDAELGQPLITVEDPREVIVECDPALRRKVRAALKLFYDDLYGVHRAYLYLPGFVLQAMEPAWSTGFSGDVTMWDWQGDPQRLAAPVVPVVPFFNQADLYGRPCGEFEAHTSVLDRINFTILNRLEVMTLQAFKQRALKVDTPNGPDGVPIDFDDIFSMEPGALWVMAQNWDIWESGTVDLGPIRQAIRDDVMDLAATTRTPLYYLTPDAANGSAEGASLAREGLVFKTADRIVQAGESWEQVMSLAFLFKGDAERAARKGMEIVWASPERFSLAEKFDAATKAQAAGVPWRHIMSTVLQFSPQEIDRMAAERAADIFTAAALGAPAQPTNPFGQMTQAMQQAGQPNAG
jgi:hypothetical protein